MVKKLAWSMLYSGQPNRAPIIIRGIVGAVFIGSGALKFLFEPHGPGRFAHIGLPFPGPLAYFVGGVEIIAGALLAVGLFTRLATLPLMIDMAVAILTTKVPLALGGGAEKSPIPPHSGFWAAVYQGRLDVAMLFSCVYLFAVGAGVWSLDAYLARRRTEARELGGVAEAERAAARA